ncbi:MAG TPA: glycosyltransferase [Bdellovibrionota bacterium]|jgi:glycosyltransferase involved in cell wall biosynthesis|nr:glycosyltransferase [Bdellovibrionota bacterium]
MHVVFAHDKPLPVAAYGGTERIIYWLMKALVRRGHRVTLIGHPTSQVSDHGIRLIAGDAASWPSLIPSDADIVCLSFPWHREVSKPHVCIIHGNGKPGEVFPQNTIFVSRSHAQNHGAECYVLNALDMQEYPESLLRTKGERSRWERFGFLAKAKWKVKNLKDCVRAVKAAHKELDVAGGRAWTLSRRVHSHGMVTQSRKLEILSGCDALLWPVRWPEPFGVAMIEAMAAGLPVIASGHGSSPEILTPDVGHICQNYAEFAEVVAHAPRDFSPKRIRDYAMEHFHADRMAADYERCFETVLSGRPLNPQAPRTQFREDAQSLLPF